MVDLKREGAVILVAGSLMAILALVFQRWGSLAETHVARLSGEATGLFEAALQERCNDRDDDLDGHIDEWTCFCTDGERRACGNNWGQCTYGSQTCVDGNWGDCGGSFLGPQPEVVDGVDNDCDQTIDEGCSVGVTVGSVCLAPYRGEVCDGLDNNHNGMADEGGICICTPDHHVLPCETGELGICARGARFCSDDGRGYNDECVVPEPMPEIPDGLDNDCDGDVDESPRS